MDGLDFASYDGNWKAYGRSSSIIAGESQTDRKDGPRKSSLGGLMESLILG